VKKYAADSYFFRPDYRLQFACQNLQNKTVSKANNFEDVASLGAVAEKLFIEDCALEQAVSANQLGD
jgi:hypothetical protein